MEAGGPLRTMACMTTETAHHDSRRFALHAFAWTAVFIAWHGYWALGGDFGFGDQEAEIPDTAWLFTSVVAAMFAAGLAVPLAVMRGVGPRRLLVWLLWAGAAVLAVRGVSGLVDDVLRFSGLVETGITGLSDEQVLGSAHPSAYTIWSTVALDSFFLAGGLLFGRTAHRARRGGRRIRRSSGPAHLIHAARASWPAWAGYAAFAWAVAYAVGVRGYQGLGGKIGLAGTLEDPEGMQRASLLAGAFILLVGVGALAFVRPWGLRLPRWLVIAPALAGSAYAAAHAFTGYVTKTLDLVGAIDLEFRGWERLDEGKQIAWDLLFYEPWFLGLGVLVTGGALHHYRRTGGSGRGTRRLLAVTAVATLALTVLSCVLVIQRFA
jgi:hypothetical protein